MFKNYNINYFRNHEMEMYVEKIKYTFNVKYPDKDKFSADRNLSNQWGYFMIFKNIGIKTQEFLKNYIMKNCVSTGDIIRNNHCGYDIQITILNIDRLKN